MTKRYIFNWMLWIAILNGLYCGLYTLSPLGPYGVIWVTYVAFPIFFITGANRREVPHFICSAIAGVVWGMVFLWCIGLFAGFGAGPALATGLGVGIVEFVLIFVHFMFAGKGWLSKVPAIFGGVAVTFSQGGENIIPLMITLALGILLCLASNEGKNLLTDDGHWKFLVKMKSNAVR